MGWMMVFHFLVSCVEVHWGEGVATRLCRGQWKQLSCGWPQNMEEVQGMVLLRGWMEVISTTTMKCVFWCCDWMFLQGWLWFSICSKYNKCVCVWCCVDMESLWCEKEGKGEKKIDDAAKSKNVWFGVFRVEFVGRKCQRLDLGIESGCTVRGWVNDEEPRDPKFGSQI